MEISGQLSGFAGGSEINLCYIIYKVENPSDSGTSNNFGVSILDTSTKKLLYSTFGNLNYPTTITYQREGLQIIVNNIPDICIGTSSNDITITLELAVSYLVTMTPSLPNFEFYPKVIEFDPSKGSK